MTEITIQQYGDTKEIVLTPSEGDVRYNGSSLERMDAYNMWNHIGNLEQLFTDLIMLQNRVVELEVWKFAEDERRRNENRSTLEDKDDQLAEVGTHLRELESQAEDARQTLHELEETVIASRKTYKSMINYTKDKIKTFETLDQPYPE